MSNILKEVLKKLIEKLQENDNILNVRGGRGYGVGHPYQVKKVKPTLGNQHFEEESEEEVDEKPVKISRAFKKRK